MLLSYDSMHSNPLYSIKNNNFYKFKLQFLRTTFYNLFLCYCSFRLLMSSKQLLYHSLPCRVVLLELLQQTIRNQQLLALLRPFDLPTSPGSRAGAARREDVPREPRRGRERGR